MAFPTASASHRSLDSITSQTAGRSLPEAALAYARDGLPVFPLVPGQKKPLVANGFYSATTDEGAIRQWWRRQPRANIGMPTGAASGLILLEIDPRHGGSYDELLRRGGPLPDTLLARSGGGGWHLFFQHPRPHPAAAPGALPGALRGKKLFKRMGKHGTLEGDPAYEVKADGGYVVLAPSVHPSGGLYAWENQLAPAAMPTWLFELLTRADDAVTPARAGDTTETGPIAPHASDAQHWLDWAMRQTGPGTGDEWGYKLAQQLLVNSTTDPKGTLLDYAHLATMNPHDPFTERDVERWLTSARASTIVRTGTPARLRAPQAHQAQRTRRRHGSDSRPPSADVQEEGDGDDDDDDDDLEDRGDEPPRRDYPWTELGNCERLVDRYGAHFRYCKAFGWCVWDGRRWQPDAELTVRRWAKETIRAMYAEASDAALEAALADDENERQQLSERAEKFQGWARASERDRMLTAMLSLARSEPGIEVAPDAFDADPWLFNCANGTLDLRTGTLHPHRREDLLMKVAPIVYDTQAEAPTFSRFVAQIMCERQELVDYLQRVLGCALTGDVSEQVWHLLVGEGENGKSTLMELIAAVMGDYAGGLEPESITMSGRPRDGSEASPDIAELKGKRFVTVTETEAGARIAAARIKKLCGGDAIQARKLRRDVFTFRPTHKLFIYTNHVPQASETTHAFWRRVRYIPFDFSLRTLPETAKDKDLPVKLRAEAAGVLAWLVAGCLAWQREGGLHPPQAVIEATAAYRDEMDVLGQFLKECCVEREGVSARAGALWETFKAWAEETGQGRGISRKKMGMALKERGYQREHTRAGEVWHGLGLLTDTATQTTLATAPAPTSAPAPATDVKGVKDGEPFPRMTPYSGAVAPSLEKTVHHPSLFTHPSQSVGGNLSLVENGRKEEEDKETEKQKERNRANASPPAPANQTNQTNQTNQATGGTLKPFAQRYDELLAQGLSADAAVRLALAERGEVEVPDDPR